MEKGKEVSTNYTCWEIKIFWVWGSSLWPRKTQRWDLGSSLWVRSMVFTKGRRDNQRHIYFVVWENRKSFSNGDIRSKIEVGRWFIKFVTIWNAWDKKCWGKGAWWSKANLVSTIYLWHISEIALRCCV